MEADERLPAGPRGAQGERGERGLSRLQGRAVVVLFVLAILPGAFGWFWWAHAVDVAHAQQQSEQAARQRLAAQQAADQRAQTAAFEAKLCATLLPLISVATLKPPAGNPATNPSRAFEQQLVITLAPLGQLAPDLGCKP